MAHTPRIVLARLEQTTFFAPLAALGFWLREMDLLTPVFAALQFGQPLHTVHPQAALLDLWVSMLAGCRSVSAINTTVRPDRLLAQAWGCSCFLEQSTIARVLDACRREQVSQLREGVQGLYRWIGQAPRHPWGLFPLTLDIDLTGLPAGRQAEGSTKGYFSGKKGGAVDSCVASAPSTTTRAWPPCCIAAIP